MAHKHLKGCEMDRAASFESLENKIKEGSLIKSAEVTPKLSSKSLLHLTDSNGNSSRRSLSQGSVSYERLRSLKQMVDRAIKEHRVFSVAGPFPTIRQALKQRGWLEKTGSSAAPGSRRKRGSHAKHGDNVGGEEAEEEPDPLMVSRLLRNCAPDLLWALRSEAVDWRGLARWQLVNRFPKALFTTKIGLSGALQHMQWFTEEGVSETLFPRCYCVNQPDEMVGFVSDFRLTACYSLLRHLLAPPPVPAVLGEVPAPAEQAKPAAKLWIPAKAVLFALTRTHEYARHLRHEDVDDWNHNTVPAPGPEGRVWDCEWDQFLTFYYQLVHEQATVAWESPQQREELTRRGSECLSQYAALRPFSRHDGTLNLWIVKPGARSCGRGIQVMNRLESILTRTQPGLGKESRFVVQKYIERPLLIYNTKFDIRQWFLVTSAQPLTIWMYRESYLRFCSQIFDMRNLHESVHLSNNAVQCRYQNCRRDPALPDENMWDCYTFQTYLRSIGRAEAWEEVIYPGMRAGIIGAMLASQDWLDSQRNCFELYGADFLLSEGDLRPWLLEVNCSPCMAPSTSVTARMCAQCLEDVLRVVVDRRDDREASTGMFELVYRQHSPPAPPYQGVALGVKGRRLTAARPRRKHRRGRRGAKATSRTTSSCSSSCSECTSEEEGRLNLAGQHRVSMASPLKVVKAEMNIPIKHKKSTSSVINQILSAHTQSAPPPLSASELRHRLERLLVENVRDKSRHCSRARSAQTNPAPSPPPVKPQTPGAPSKTKKTKTKGVAGKFKGKVSGKNMAVVERDNDIRFVRDNKSSKQSKSDKVKDSNNNKTSVKKPKEEEEIDSEENQNTNADQDNNNETGTDVPKVTLETQDLLLQPDNLRSTKVEIEVPDSLTEEECFKDPGRSLALVKEWRRRLEATRASCEHMLAQLKAFRDPPAKPVPTVIPTFPIPAVAATAASDAASCLSIGRKIRKISTNKIVSAPVVSPA